MREQALLTAAVEKRQPDYIGGYFVRVLLNGLFVGQVEPFFRREQAERCATLIEQVVTACLGVDPPQVDATMVAVAQASLKINNGEAKSVIADHHPGRRLDDDAVNDNHRSPSCNGAD